MKNWEAYLYRMNRKIHITSCIFLLLVFVACNFWNPENGDDVEEYFEVTKVVDGDTFWVDDGSEKGRKVRLIGVDAPESRATFRKKVGYFGKESKAYLTKQLLNLKVKLEYDVDHTDRYGRTLAYVYLEDGTFVNAELVKQGFGMVMTIPPNVRFAEEFVKLQQEARDHNRGLWSK